MDSLQEILGKKDFTPPNEMELIKDYIFRKYESNCYIKIERGTIIISVPSSSLASTLQFERGKIKDKFRLKEKLVIRVGRY